ncbi:MAG: sirohydrochlorin chelatase [Candidatus Competibacterales bacterium]
MSQRCGVLICGHGSRSKAAVAEFTGLVTQLADHFPHWPVAHGYLEFATPVIREGLDTLRHQGVERILAVPGMLFAAGHVKNDIPAVLNTYKAQHNIAIDFGRDLGVDPKMLKAAADRIQEAIAAADARRGAVPAHETCLVVIGRGASDPDANANVAKVARLLWEGFGFGWCQVGYSGVTFPLVEPSLDHAARLGYRRVVVFPYFLFTGILIDRIYGFTDQTASRYPDMEFVKASYLNDHPQVIATFAERVGEILDGQGLMNCGMCKYRTQVLGFEADVGQPQESHHHHVEGQGVSAPGCTVENCELCDTFCTGACRLVAGSNHHHRDHDHHDHSGHGHHHGHAPYPHAHHPLGPTSVLKSSKSSRS